jgi:hypothetical protein
MKELCINEPWSYGSWIYNHWYCEFEFRSGWGVQHYLIMWLPRNNWNIVESDVKYDQTNKQTLYPWHARQ